MHLRDEFAMSRSTGRARQLRRDATSAEAALWSVLRNRGLNGFNFRRQWPIDRYGADFVCIDARLIVEVDAATHGGDREILRDATRTEVLALCGYEVLRVGNVDVLGNIDGVRETILAAIEHRITL